MQTMQKIKSTARIVEFILATDKQARNSDSYLYLKVLEFQAKQAGIDIRNVLLVSFLVNSESWGFAPFETVRRTRQKLQAQFPGLASTEKVQGFKDAQEETFREYARE